MKSLDQFINRIKIDTGSVVHMSKYFDPATNNYKPQIQ